jgi:hypothetical protein
MIEKVLYYIYRELENNTNHSKETKMIKDLTVTIEPLDITFDARSWDKGNIGEIICHECDEEYAEYRLHVHLQTQIAQIPIDLCHECFCKNEKELTIIQISRMPTRVVG